MFFLVFFLFNPWDWNVLGSERLVHSWCHIDWRNTKIYIHRASQMEWKHGKCWKLPIFKGQLWVFSRYLSHMKTVSMFYSSTFYSLFLPFFVQEISKFKYDKAFCQTSASISKFEWFEQPWYKFLYDGTWKLLHTMSWGII